MQWALDRDGVSVATLVRLRKDRCFYADPATVARTGRPPQQGHTFDCTSPASWLPPTDAPPYGTVRVRAGATLHPKQQNHAARGTRKTRPVVRGRLILVEVSRVPGPPRPWQLLWLWWSGPGTPDLDVIWRASIRRFDQEHTFRFLKAGAQLDHPAGARKPTAGPGWWWRRLPNSGWRAPGCRTSACPGNVRGGRIHCPPSACVGPFVRPCSSSARQQTRQNPVDALPDDPQAVCQVPHRAIRLCRSAPESASMPFSHISAPDH